MNKTEYIKLLLCNQKKKESHEHTPNDSLKIKTKKSQWFGNDNKQKASLHWTDCEPNQTVELTFFFKNNEEKIFNAKTFQQKERNKIINTKLKEKKWKCSKRLMSN